MSQEPTSSHALTDAELRQAIDGCDREPIHIPGTIQPHGYLIGVDAERTICFMSDNCAALFERPLTELVGLSAAGLVPAQDIDGLEQALAGTQALTTSYREIQLRDGHGGFPVLNEVVDAVSSQGYKRESVWAVRLALDEALVNAVKHGNKSNPDKLVHIDCRVDDQAMIIQIEDEGQGFVPDQLPD
ncbi:MAG: ATP-binding protein, partial [Pseudomonadota bacterium]